MVIQANESSDWSTEALPPEKRQTRLKAWVALIFITSIVLVFSFSVAIVHASTQPPSLASFLGQASLAVKMTDAQPRIKAGTQESAPGLCGNSSSEARMLGCTFDQLTWSWYPPSCPHYANDEFVKAEEWKFYLDEYGHNEATAEDWEKAMNNELHLHGERREHITHCVYLMLSVAQIVRDGTPYAQKLVDYGHLAHCASMMLKTMQRDRYWNSMDTLVPFVDYSVTC